jgi:hypothetical protein
MMSSPPVGVAPKLLLQFGISGPVNLTIRAFWLRVESVLIAPTRSADVKGALSGVGMLAVPL